MKTYTRRNVMRLLNEENILSGSPAMACARIVSRTMKKFAF